MGYAFRLAAILSILLGTSFARTTSFIQQERLPDAASSTRREAKIEFAAFAAEVAADGISTRMLVQQGCGEHDPLARPFVRAGVGGQVAASVLGFAAVGAAWIILRRTHHAHLATWMLRTAVAGEGINDIRQFRVMATQCH